MDRDHRALPCLALAIAIAIALTQFAAAQCPLQWQASEPIPFVYGDVRATTVWDPDGAGPSPALLVVGGNFSVGAQLGTSIAAFDGANWSTLGSPPFPDVTALTVWNGLLVAAGRSLLQGSVATWNGSAWSVIGITSAPVNTMAVFQNNLIIGGQFGSTSGVVTRRIAQWNGSAWSQLAQGVFPEVSAMTVFGSQLWVGGSISQAGTLPAGNLAIWNGTSWSAGATFDAPVRSLAARNGSTAATSFVFAGGDFSVAGGVAAPRVARFSSSTGAWTALPGLPTTSCVSLHVRSTGLTTFQLHAALGGVIADKVWRLNGTTWTSLGSTSLSGSAQPTSLAFFNGQYAVALESPGTGSSPLAQAVRVHDGTSWQPALGPGFDDRVEALAASGGEIVVAGRFRRNGAVALERIARGSPGAWQPLGTGLGGGVGASALCVCANGDIIAGGDFTSAGGVAVNNIARWNGSTWGPLSNGVNGTVYALLELPNGDLIAGGNFTTASGVTVNHVARWNGAAWSALGSGMSSFVFALTKTSNGDVIAGGSFTSAGGVNVNYVARWNGATWTPLGTGVGGEVGAVVAMPNDDILVGGVFLTAGGIVSPCVARWTGSAWLAQSTATSAWDNGVATLVALPNDDYIAGGATSQFGLGNTEANLARHTGGITSLQWSPLDLNDVAVTASTLRANGDVVVAGTFLAAGGIANHGLAVLRPTCPATAVAYGGGCTGSGGFNSLVATTLPWTGSPFRARATGMPNLGIAVVVTGLSPLAVPMPLLLPQGVAGCTALVSPDLLDLTLPSSGIATTQIVLPTAVSLAGQTFRHQVVPLELDLAGNILAVTGTNALALTIGVL